MPSTISLRLPDKLLGILNKLSKMLDRPRSYVIRKALENYIREYADYQIALDRLRDKDDEIISSEDLKNYLGI